MTSSLSEALANIARIGFQRFRRQSALAAQMGKPARHLERESLVGAGEFDRLSESWVGHWIVFKAMLALEGFS